MLNLEKICRLCLLQSDNPAFLFDIGPDTENLLNSILKIEFNPTSRLPYKICIVCQKKIIDFCAFLKEAHDNQDKLLDIFLNQKLEVITTTNSPIFDYEFNIEREVVINNMEVDPKLDMSIDVIEETNDYKSRFEKTFDGFTTIYWNNTFETIPESPPGPSFNENLQMGDLSAHVSSSSVEMEDDGKFPPISESNSVQLVYSELSSNTEYASEASEWAKEYEFEETTQMIDAPTSTTSHSIVQYNQPDAAPTLNKRSPCDICGIWVLNVKQHKKCVHTYEGDLKCEFCPQIFHNRLKLYMHVRYKHDPTHYVCVSCGKTLKSKNQLKEHTYQKHKKGEYLYHCEWCDYKFNYRTSLSLHNKKFHPIQYQQAIEEKRAQRFRPH